MNLHSRVAAVLVLLALIGCTQGPTSQGQAPYAPYSHDDEERMDRPP
jgi:uncharacterized membrane protein